MAKSKGSYILMRHSERSLCWAFWV